jgi:hypothetical protein
MKEIVDKNKGIRVYQCKILILYILFKSIEKILLITLIYRNNSYN